MVNSVKIATLFVGWRVLFSYIINVIVTYVNQGIARKLVKTAMQEAAKKREMRYSDLKKIDRGVRRHFHDDITVVVVFFDSNSIAMDNWSRPTVSLRGGGVTLPANSLAPLSVPSSFWNCTLSQEDTETKRRREEQQPRSTVAVSSAFSQKRTFRFKPGY